MERFVTRHRDRIVGILSGFDRVLFRGTLRSISFLEGMDKFLSSQRVLYKDFGPFVERISAGVKAHATALAQQTGRPFEYLRSGAISKEDRARAIMIRDGITEGLICIFSCVEPCWSFTIRRDRKTRRLRVERCERKCLHLYFYYRDRDFGLLHIRLQTWLPLTIQVCVNGRDWLAQQLTHARMPYTQVENAILAVSDLPRAQALADQFPACGWRAMLDRLAQAVNPWLHREAGLFRSYYWTVRQSEYATDVLFRDPAPLHALYPALVHHAIEHFATDDVLRFLGRRTNASFTGEVRSTLTRRPEGIRIKHWVEENSIKLYDKLGCLLRVETTLNNPERFKVRRRITRHGQRVLAWRPLRKGIADMQRRADLARAANARYLDALSVVGEPTPSHHLLDSVSQRVMHHGRWYRPLHPVSPTDAALFRAVLDGKFAIQGFRNRDLCAALAPPRADPASARRASARLTRSLRLLRAHRLIHKVPTTRYYRVSPKGHLVMTTALAFRDRDIALLAA
jgi:hypothetical protein